ncbi:hypothetical protein LCGC14_2558480, partial [marine sediment metagenome]
MVKKIFNIYVLLFLHGIILAALFFLITLQSHTQSIYQHIVSSTIQSGMSQEEGAIALLHATHDLIPTNEDDWGIFGNWPQNPTLKERFFGKTPSILIKGGACGNFVHVLGRSLQEAGYDIR